METPPDQKAFGCSARVYRRLLLLYPAPHRREYGAAMEQLFQDQCRDAWRDAHGRGLTVLWLRVAGDLLWTATVAHFRELKQRISMLNQIGLAFREEASVRTTFRVIFMGVFLVVLGASVLLALLTPTNTQAPVELFCNSIQRKFLPPQNNVIQRAAMILIPFKTSSRLFSRTQFWVPWPNN